MQELSGIWLLLNDLTSVRLISERFKSIFDTTQQMITVMDKDFQILYENPALVHHLGYQDRAGKAFLSFLFGISIRLMANHLRKKRERLPITEEMIRNLPATNRTDTSAEVSMLHRAIARLPIAQKESIILYEISGFSIREIAALHNVSESAVKKRLERGRKKLTALLVQQPITQNNKV